MTKSSISLTQTSVAKLPITGKDYRVFDTKVPMMNVRVSKKGVKTFYFCYRDQTRRQKWYRIGRADSITVEQARIIARRVQAEVDQGADPLAERHSSRTEPLMSDLWDAYLTQHAMPMKKPSSVREDERLWRLHIAPAFANEPVRSLSLAAIRKLHADMRSTPGAANRMRALLSKMFSFAIDNEWRASNPCSGVKRYPENRKERFLSQLEASRLWDVLENDHDQCAATIIMLLLLTGARRGEVLSMEWSDLNLLHAAPSWTLRRGEQKGERGRRSDFVRPLGVEAVHILNRWRHRQVVPSLQWVFPSDRKADAHRSELKFAWNRIRNAANIEDVRIHDLRHSYASFAINAGEPLESIGATLGHKDLRTTQRYAHLIDETKRATVEAVSKQLLQPRG